MQGLVAAIRAGDADKVEWLLATGTDEATGAPALRSVLRSLCYSHADHCQLSRGAVSYQVRACYLTTHVLCGLADPTTHPLPANPLLVEAVITGQADIIELLLQHDAANRCGAHCFLVVWLDGATRVDTKAWTHAGDCLLWGSSSATGIAIAPCL